MSVRTSPMDEEEQVHLVAVEEEDEIQDSLIRKSKLQNTQPRLDTTNDILDFLNPKDEAPSNGHTNDEPQNGNSTTTQSQNGAILGEEVVAAENNGGNQETENNIVYYHKDEGGNFISAFSEEKSTKEGATLESSGIGSHNGIVDTSPNPVIGYQHEKHTKDSFSALIRQPSGVIDSINTKEVAKIETSDIGSQNGIVETSPDPDSFSVLIRQPSGVIDSINTKEGAKIETSDIGSQNGIVETSPDPVTDYQQEKHTKDSFFVSILQPSGVTDNINTISQETSAIKEIESDNSDLIDGSDLDVTEIPLEKVLLEQKSHDLYCPNCNSCITRRVILRKRKRRSQPLGADVKHHKIEAEIETEAGASSSKPISNQDPVSSNAHNISSIPPEETYDRDREPEIFRCLACFSFFIPSGNGFKLFGRKSEKSTSQKDQISEPNKNWFSSIFAPNKGRTPQQQGNLDKGIKVSSNKAEHAPLVIDNENRSSSSPDRTVSPARVTDGIQQSGAIKPQESALLGNMTTDFTYKSQENTIKDELGVDNGKEMLLDQKYDEAVTIDDGIVTTSNGKRAAAGDLETRLDGLETRLDGLDLIISSERGHELLDRSPADPKYNMEYNNSPDDEAMRNNFVTNGKAYIAVDIPLEYEQPTETLHDADTINVRGNNRDSISTTRNQIQIIKTDINIQSEDNLNANWEVSSKTTSYKETIVTVGAPTEVASQITEDSVVSSEQLASQLGGHTTSVVERRASEAGENYGIEIIKSIVYGGLVESITSLSVVSSAAGSGASTLHTLALGMANLIGGIFIICHNLYQLKYDEADDAINQVSEVSEKNGKYQELLGKRKNFVLHAFVAILSYLIFGLLAPVIFGFSFRKSDDKELKLAVVTAACFLCILVLAIGKAYVQTPPKTYVGTVFRYLILGFMVSGVSYVAGMLFERLLDDLGLFENSTSLPTILLPVKPSNKQAWTSF